MEQVTVSKIFPAGAGWQAASIVADAAGHQADSLEALKETLRARIRNRLASVTVRIPYADGEAIAAVYREGEVVHRVDEAMDVRLTARLPRGVVGRLASRAGIEIEEVA